MRTAPRRRDRHTLVALSAGMFLVLFDVTVVNVALPDLRRSMHTSLGTLQWVVDGYTVPLAALLLVGGSLADRWGPRRLLMAGIVVFGLGSLGCALARDPALLVGLRAVQGVGAAALLPGSQAGVSATFAGERQARALGIWAAISSAALPAGPVLGGLLVHWFGWAAVFWLNVPVTAVLVVVVRRVLPPRRQHDGATRPADVLGGLSATVLLAALVLAVIATGGHGRLVAPATAVAVLAVLAFVAAERRAAHPMLPLELLRVPGFAVATGVAAAMNFVGIGSILVLTLFLQGQQGRSSIASGLALLPLFLPLVLLSPWSGRLVDRHGVRPPMVAGLVLGALGSASLVTVTAGSSYPRLLGALLGLGAGMGLLTAAVVSAVVQAAPADRAGLAGGVTNAARQAGGAVGIAVYGALVGHERGSTGFVAGLHQVGLVGAATWFAAAVVTLAALGSSARGRPAGRA